MNAHGFVVIERENAEQVGEFAGSVAAKQIHLEETLLGVEKAQGKGCVVAVFPGNGGDTLSVPLHRDGALQVFAGDCALEQRQAFAQEPVAIAHSDKREEREQQ